MVSTSSASSSSFVSHLLVPRELTETREMISFPRKSRNKNPLEENLLDLHLLCILGEETFGSEAILVLLDVQHSTIKFLKYTKSNR